MISVTQFAQHLLRLDPQRSPNRLTLFNYLKHFLEPTEQFRPATIERFYAHILNFDHWQNNAQSLAQEVREDVHGFLRLNKGQEQEWEEFRHIDEVQVVNLKHG